MLKKLNRSSTCLFVQATLPTCRYVVAREGANLPVLEAAGSFEIEDTADLVEKVRDQLSDGPSVSRAVLLLPRGEVDVSTLRLPPASDAELPELVANLLAQQAEEHNSAVHDFVVSKLFDDGSRDVLTFSVAETTLNTWKQRFREINVRLEGITFGGLGAVSLLNQLAKDPAKTTVVVTTTDQDTDLAVVEKQRPVLFRTIPRATGGEQFVVEQLAADIQRTLALQDHEDDEAPRIYLVGTNDTEHSEAAKCLTERLGIPIYLVNPFDQLAGDVHQLENVKRPSRFANLLGTVCAWNRSEMATNMLAPRRPPQPPSLWSRYGFWSSVAVCLLALVGYILWEQAADQRLELETQRTKLQRLLKPVKRSQTKQAMAAALNRWQANEINWLDELHYLTEKLPAAEAATIGSLTMTVATGQLGRIDMPVVISDSELRSVIEDAVNDERHTISNKRLTDASNRGVNAWRFQSTISVKPTPRSGPTKEVRE